MKNKKINNEFKLVTFLERLPPIHPRVHIPLNVNSHFDSHHSQVIRDGKRQYIHK